MNRHCPVCGCDALREGPTCGSWVCALALAYGWPDPLPVLPRRADVPPPPKTAVCPACGGDMPRIKKDHSHGGPMLRQFCSHSCANRDRAAKARQVTLDRLDEVRDLIDMGESPAAIAARFGVKPCTLAKDARSVGDKALAVRFERERNVTRYAHRHTRW